MNHALDKRILRKQLQQSRQQLEPVMRMKQSADIRAAAEPYIASLRRLGGASPLTIFSYLAYRDEPDTLPLLDDCWQQQDIVLAPRIDRTEQGVFHLHAITGIGDVEPGAYGIPEPLSTLPIYEPSKWDRIQLVIVPGLGYDRQGGRIGYGGGFYDRFMNRLLSMSSRRPLLASLAFDRQIIEHIPMETHDFTIDLLFTPNGVITTEAGRKHLLNSNI